MGTSKVKLGFSLTCTVIGVLMMGIALLAENQNERKKEKLLSNEF